MKGKKWLAKPLALGLAIATAVTSIGIPGGLLAPQTAYAAEDEDNSDGSDGVLAASNSIPYLKDDYIMFNGEKNLFGILKYTIRMFGLQLRQMMKRTILFQKMKISRLKKQNI